MKGPKRALERVGRSVCVWEVALADRLLTQGHCIPAESDLQRTETGAHREMYVVAWSRMELPDKEQDAKPGLASGSQASRTEGEEKH